MRKKVTFYQKINTNSEKFQFLKNIAYNHSTKKTKFTDYDVEETYKNLKNNYYSGYRTRNDLTKLEKLNIKQNFEAGYNRELIKNYLETIKTRYVNDNVSTKISNNDIYLISKELNRLICHEKEPENEYINANNELYESLNVDFTIIISTDNGIDRSFVDFNDFINFLNTLPEKTVTIYGNMDENHKNLADIMPMLKDLKNKYENLYITIK